MKKIKLVPALLLASFFWTGQAHARGTVSCPEGEKFVKEFLLLDFAGGRLKPNPKVDAMVSGPEQPGWDAAAVVNGFKIRSCHPSGNGAEVTVSYDLLGTMSSSSLLDHPDFSSEPKFESHRFHVVFENGRLRLNDVADFRPHVSMDAAIQDLQDLAARNSDDPAVTKGTDRAIEHLRASAAKPASHRAYDSNDSERNSGGGDRQPASTFEP